MTTSTLPFAPVELIGGPADGQCLLVHKNILEIFIPLFGLKHLTRHLYRRIDASFFEYVEAL